uniref:Ion channel n=1 Tax=Angiostrongylus cantonensis TaxID=6313 RepID=A0A0K0D4V9_ANGCA
MAHLGIIQLQFIYYYCFIVLLALLPLLGLLLYTLLGAVLFCELEGPNEQYELAQLKKQREELFESTVYRLNNVRAMQPMAALNHTRKNLLRFQQKLGIEPVNLEDIRWNFWGAVFYCMTVYTTIGYGNIVPTTTAGRVLTILYAFIGIPFAVLTLFALGTIFAKLCKTLWKMLIKSTTVVSKDLERKVTKAVGFDEEAQLLQSSTTLSDEDLLSFPISFLVLLTILWVFFCAFVFTLLEDWSYGTSLYFTLISFTTIGFGDVLPSEYDYIVVVGFLLLIGLSLVSTVLTLLQQQIEALATGVQSDVDREYKKALVEAANEGEISPDLKKTMTSNANSMETISSPAQSHEVDHRSMDAILSRMPLKQRVLYRVMPKSAKKRLANELRLKTSRRNEAVQTDMFLLQALLHEEILKMELNNELPSVRQMTSSPSRLVTSGINVKSTHPVSISHDIPKPTVKTTALREDEV